MLTIEVEVSPGESIERASQDAVRLAHQLGCTVKFDFNGVTCLARPDGDPVLLAENQQKEQRRSAVKFARSVP